MVQEWEADTETDANGNRNMLMETNERAPLLSDDTRDLAACLAWAVSEVDETKSTDWNVLNVARKLHEAFRAKITSGELAVVKTATKGNEVSPWCCSECGLYLGRIDDPNFCPGCGAKIVEA